MDQEQAPGYPSVIQQRGNPDHCMSFWMQGLSGQYFQRRAQVFQPQHSLFYVSTGKTGYGPENAVMEGATRSCAENLCNDWVNYRFFLGYIDNYRMGRRDPQPA